MRYTLPPLPYTMQDLEPSMSSETLYYHYEKHHKAYIDKTNELLEKEGLHKSLEEIIRTESGELFNQAAQAWNHSFFWYGMDVPGENKMSSTLLTTLEDSFGNLEKCKKDFVEKGMKVFGTGWVWLVKDAHNKVKIMCTEDGNNPWREGILPLLACDVWEHAYYIDYRNDRKKYLENFWNLINWNFVEKNFNAPGISKMSALMQEKVKEPSYV